MTRETKRHGYKQILNTQETSASFRARINMMIDEFVKLEEAGWDLDWSHVEIDSEVSYFSTHTVYRGEQTDEYMEVNIKLLGRKDVG